MKNWEEEKPDMEAKVQHLTEGAAIVEAARKEAELEEARKKAQAEKENEWGKQLLKSKVNSLSTFLTNGIFINLLLFIL